MNNPAIFFFFFVAMLSLSCPVGTDEMLNGKGCQETCNDPAGQQNCQLNTLIRTCTCQKGNVLHNDECINPEACGCVSPGKDSMKVNFKDLN